MHATLALLLVSIFSSSWAIAADSKVINHVKDTIEKACNGITTSLPDSRVNCKKAGAA
jgi:hypothetical protein